MEKVLNTQRAARAMEEAGVSQAELAKRLGVSREAVSQWLKQKSFPRPDKLLKLAKLLDLDFNSLVVCEEKDAPIVAFRRMKGTKTKDHHVERAQEIGRFLRHLVPYLPFDRLEVPPVLKSPSCDYGYLRQVANKVREDINVGPESHIDFRHLIRRFSDLQTVLVPVVWGSRKAHENAVHIYLPDSQTTWVYLNLDVNAHDFKFWMAHELGHCLSPNLRGEAAEDFADAFAGALLFSEEKAAKAYGTIDRMRGKKAQLQALMEVAESEVISAYTIYLQINRFAAHAGKPLLALEPELFPWITNFNKQHLNISESLLGDSGKAEAKEFIARTRETLETPFFEVLSRYLKESGKGVGFVQSVLEMPFLDARGIHEELT